MSHRQRFVDHKPQGPFDAVANEIVLKYGLHLLLEQGIQITAVQPDIARDVGNGDLVGEVEIR